MDDRRDPGRSERSKRRRGGRRLGGIAIAVLAAALLVAATGHALATGALWSSTTARPSATITPTAAMGPMPGMSITGMLPSGRLITMVEGPLQMQVIPLTGKAPTWDEIAKVYRMLAQAKAATAKYQDVHVAERDGYVTAPILFVAGQGMHYLNPAYLPTRTHPAFDLLHPPVLVYNRIHGKIRLSGLMYYMPYRTTPQQLAAIFPASLASWHRHINICVGGATASDPLAATAKILPIHDAATCTAKNGVFIAHTGWMVHTWIWHSGSALFAMDM
jgi:hypothetical protein